MALKGKIIQGVIKVNTRLGSTNKSMQELQVDTLRKLLHTASHTSFGKHYNFEEILRSDDIISTYQEHVPFYDYDRIYKEWWHKLLDGEKDVTWPGKIKHFALSSGTTSSSSKKIPITHDMLISIRKAGVGYMRIIQDLKLPVDFYEKGMLMLGGSTSLEKIDNNAKMGDLSGILTGNLPVWLNKFYKPGQKISKEKDWNTKLDKITREADKWDIGVIAGVPAWVQMLIERIIDHYKVNSIHDIWPNFKIYVHGGVSLQPYKNYFNTLLGKDIIYLETYLASEGFIAYETLDNSGGMRLVMHNGIFYEFIPFNSDNFSAEGDLLPGAKTVNLTEISEEEIYAIVLSTNAGAWRYLIGDTVKFTDVSKQELAITGRIKHFLSLCGEHLSVGNMNDAISIINKELDLNIKEFTVVGDKVDNYFVHTWWIGADHEVDTTLLRERLDAALFSLNDDYKTERSAALKDIRVNIIPNELFYRWMEDHNKIGGSFKFPRVLSSDQKESWRSFLTEKNIKTTW